MKSLTAKFLLVSLKNLSSPVIVTVTVSYAGEPGQFGKIGTWDRFQGRLTRLEPGTVSRAV